MDHTALVHVDQARADSLHDLSSRVRPRHLLVVEVGGERPSPDELENEAQLVRSISPARPDECHEVVVAVRVESAWQSAHDVRVSSRLPWWGCAIKSAASKYDLP